MKTYKTYNQDQMSLIPQRWEDCLRQDHMALFINDIIEEIDISEIQNVYETELRGYPPYHPQMMLKILIYGYCNGVRSSRKIAKKCEDDVAFRYLAGNNFPKFRAIADFRQRHLAAFQKLFVDVLIVCQEADLVKLGHVSLDGTKIKANASKHKAMSYERMQTEEERLAKEIEALVSEAQRIDQSEDKLYGKNKRGDEIPKDLRRREDRLAKIRKAKTALEKRVAKERKKDKDDGEPPLPKGKDQYNFTDPESRIMPASDDKKCFIQGYNGQLAVDSKNQIIVANNLCNQSNDQKQLKEVVPKIEANLNQKPIELSADAGYFSEDHIIYLREEEKIAPYIPPDRQRHGTPSKCPRGPIPENMTIAEGMRRFLSTKRGRKQYALRKIIVEPVFGQIKNCMGFRQFSLRGLAKCQGEWDLVCLCHNLLKVYRYGTRNA
jgi:transposase/cell division septum initiation protein DivIVA